MWKSKLLEMAKKYVEGTKSLLDAGTCIGVLVALAIVILTLVILWLRRRKKKGRVILIFGPSEVGKTALFCNLTMETVPETVASVEANSSDYYAANDSAPLVLRDIPGDERVRRKFWVENRVGIRGILFLCDASGGNKAVREASDALYEVLTDDLVRSVRPNILILCNKQDQPTAKGRKLLKSLLERELTTIRLTKSGTLKSTGVDTSSKKLLGSMDKDFEFQDVSPIKIEFQETIANKPNPSLNKIKEWLSRNS